MVLKRFWNSVIWGALFLVAAGTGGGNAAAFSRPDAITVVVAGDLEPYSFVDSSGVLRGEIKDLWELWASRAGVAIQFRISDWTSAVASLKAGEGDVIGLIPDGVVDPALALSGEHLASLSYHVFYDHHVPEIGGEEGLAKLTVGVVEGGACHKRIAAGGRAHLRLYPDFDALMQATARGEVNVFCSGRYRAAKQLNDLGLGSDFRISPPLFESGVLWATRASDPGLHRFIAAGFASISAQERQVIAQQWGIRLHSSADQRSLRSLNYFLLAALAMVVAAIGWNVSLQRKVKATTRDLRETEMRFSAILNNLPEAAWVKDVEGRYVAVNRSLARICSSDPNTMIGKTDFDLFLPGIAETYRRNDTMVIERMQPVLLVEPFGDNDASVQWVESTKAPFFDDNGLCVGTVGIFRDITFRKNAEDKLSLAVESLRVSESRYRDLVCALPVGVFETDRDGNIIFANDFGWSLLGDPQGRRMPPWLSHVHPDDRTIVGTAFRAMLVEGRPFSHDFRLVSGAGDQTWVQAVGRARSESGGAVISVLDIGERRRADERLRAREEEFRALAELSPDTIARYDLDARRTYANPAFAALAGVPVQDLLGRTPNQGGRSPQMQAYEDTIRNVVASGQGATFELWWTDGAGKSVASDIRIVPQHGADGVVGVIAIGRDVTRLKAIEDELRLQNDKLAAILDNLPGSVYTMHYGADGQKKLAFSTLSLTAVDSAPQTSEAFRSNFHPDDHSLLFVEVPNRLRRQGVSDHKFRFMRADGTVIWLHAHERVREWQGGDMIVDGLVFDVTEEMEAKARLERTSEELRKTASRLATLLDHLPGLAYRKEYHRDGSRITYTSAGFREIMGRDFDGGDDQERLATIWHPEDHDKIRGYGAEIRNGANRAEIKVRFIHADGSVRWVLVRERVVERREGFVAAEGLMLDITSEMEARQAYDVNADELLRTTTKLNTLVNNLPGIVFRMEYLPPDRKRMIEVFGTPAIPAEALSEKGMRASVHPDDVDLMYRQFPARLRAEGSAEQTFRMKGAEGRWCWVHTRERVVERIGDILIVEGQAIDITAEVMTKRDLEESERRSLRAEARLREGQRFEALGQFAGGIAHDFNNLLGAMLGYARFIIEDAPASSENRRHAARIIEIGEKGRTIVDKILNYSQRSEMVLSRFTVGELVSDVASLWGADTLGGAVLHVDNGLEDIEIDADRVQLTRMLMNLCVNSRDAMDDRPGTVSIGAHQTEFDAQVLERLVERDQFGEGSDVETWSDAQGNAWVVAGRLPKVLPHVALYVADTGMGMEAKLMEQAFKPFFTTKDRSRGTGLGLAVVHGVVIAHGGAIIGRSRPGEGTRFDILLPLRRAPAQPADIFVPVKEPEQIRVLLVDDHVDVLEAMSEALKRIDFAVDAYSNPSQALDAFRAAPDQWDIVITDQIMPTMRGIDFVKAVKAVQPEMPCVLCSGYSDELSTDACVKAGVAKMLRKPVGMAELTTVIKANASARLTNV